MGPKSSRVIWTAVAGIVVFAVAMALAFPRFLTPLTNPDANAIYRLNGREWLRVYGLPGAPSEVKITPKGTVWVSTNFHGGLCRFDGREWNWFNGNDFHTTTNWIAGRFALDGEDLWAATTDAVIHFDGRRWTSYPEAIAGGSPRSIIADGGRVCLLDEKGNMSYFDGKVWSLFSMKEVLPEVRWGTRLSRQPALARTSGSYLWVVWDGLWRFEGAKRSEVRINGQRLTDAQLAGVEPDALWVTRGSQVLLVSSAGQILRTQNAAELGFRGRTDVRKLVSGGNRTWAAGSDGLTVFEDGRWRHFPQPQGMGQVRSMAVAPDGTLWAIGMPTTGPRKLIPLFLIIVASGLALTASLRLGRERKRRTGASA